MPVKYSAELVARVKGARAAGISKKHIANATGLSENAVHMMLHHARRDVLPAMDLHQAITAWLNDTNRVFRVEHESVKLG